MNNNPGLKQRMNDVNKLLASNPIEILTIPSDKCPHFKCDGTGWIQIKDWSKRHIRGEQDEWREQCECYKQRMRQIEINRKLELAGIPKIFKGLSLNSFDLGAYMQNDSKDMARLAKKAAGNYVVNYKQMAEVGKGMYFYSNIKGSGKTRLVSSLANALVKEHGISIAFVKAQNLFKEVQKTFSKKSEMTELEVLAAFKDVDVLIIDDIAVEKPSDFAERTLFDVFDYRLEQKKPVLLTSNRTIDELDELYPGERVSSRIRKICYEIYMPEESVRDLESKKENADIEKILFGGV